MPASGYTSWFVALFKIHGYMMALGSEVLICILLCGLCEQFIQQPLGAAIL